MALGCEHATGATSTRPLSFNLEEAIAEGSEARVGTISVHRRSPIQSPHYLALSSRGAVPHVSQDMMRDNTALMGVYVGLEDCESCRATGMSLYRTKLIRSLVLEPGSP